MSVQDFTDFTTEPHIKVPRNKFIAFFFSRDISLYKNNGLGFRVTKCVRRKICGYKTKYKSRHKCRLCSQKMLVSEVLHV